MPTSMNGWPASPTLRTRAVVIAGATFHMVDNDDAVTVLTYVISEYASYVEPLQPTTCACFSYRANVNNPSKLSNHSSATAVDLNWSQHPNNTLPAKTFRQTQVDNIHAIYESVPELNEVVHWGGDWFPPGLVPDPMHHELHDHDLAKLARVAARIRALEDDMPAYKDWDDESKKQLAADIVAAILKAPVGGDKDPVSVKQALNQARTAVKKP